MQLLVVAVAAMLVWFAGSGGTVVEKLAIDGPDEQGYRWVLDRAPIADVEVHVVSDVYLRCEEEDLALSCARRDYEAKPPVCDVYLPTAKTRLTWEEEHERRHCAGWSHPGRALTF